MTKKEVDLTLTLELVVVSVFFWPFKHQKMVLNVLLHAQMFNRQLKIQIFCDILCTNR